MSGAAHGTTGIRAPLSGALGIGGLLVIFAGTVESFVLDELLSAPFVVGIVLIALCVAGRWHRAVARVVPLLPFLLPVGASAACLRGDRILAVPIFDALGFGWLSWNALSAARASAPS